MCHPPYNLFCLLVNDNACGTLQVAELIFLGVALLLVLGFFAYHTWLISRATTTYETFKWREVARRLRAESLVEHADGQGQEHLSLSAAAVKGRLWPASGQSKPAVAAPQNIYDKGFAANFKDALLPPSWAGRKAAVQAKKKL